MKQPAVLIFRYKKKADSISHWREKYFIISNKTFTFIYLYVSLTTNRSTVGRETGQRCHVWILSYIYFTWNCVYLKLGIFRIENMFCCTMLFVLSKEPISKFSLIYLFQCISLCRWGYESQPLVRVEYLLTLGLNFIGWVQWLSGNFFHLTNFHIAREVLKCTSEAL